MEKVQGFIDHFIYRNEQNGYSVIELHMDEEDLICVGYFPANSQGETVEICGEYVEHALYGRQLKASRIETIAPKDATQMERYLASGAVKGVGPALAKRLVKKFGDDTFRIIEEEPERLSEIKGISERMAIDISTQMDEKRELREAMIFLQKYGISNTISLKIYDTYGSRLYHILRDNPYQMAEELEGIGFKKADEIARKVGIRADSEYRIKSGICYTLIQSMGEGHVYLPKEELVQRAAILLEVNKEQIEIELPNLAIEKKITIKKENDKVCCYILQMYYE